MLEVIFACAAAVIAVAAVLAAYFSPELLVLIFAVLQWDFLLFISIIIAVIGVPFQIWILVKIGAEIGKSIGESRISKDRDFAYIDPDYRAVRHRVRLRRARRAAGIIPVLLVVLLATGYGSLEVVDDYKDLPLPVAVILLSAGAAGALVFIAYDCRRRIADLFGDAYLIEGVVLEVSDDKRVEMDEPKVPAMLIQAISEFFCPTIALEIDKSSRLTRRGLERDNTRFSGLRAIDLVSGSSAGMVPGYAAIICTRAGRCLGRESQFVRLPGLACRQESCRTCPAARDSAAGQAGRKELLSARL